jgi:hypothetical protein
MIAVVDDGDSRFLEKSLPTVSCVVYVRSHRNAVVEMKAEGSVVNEVANFTRK